MSLKRTLAVQLPRAAGSAVAGLLLLGLGGLSACSSYSTFKDVPIDCTADDGYDFLRIGNAEDAVGGSNWWGSGDTPPYDGGISRAFAIVEPIPDGGRCGSQTAEIIRSSHYNDWGSLFGYNNFNGAGAENYQGISFWARAPGATSKGFTILLDDDNSASSGANCKPVADGGTQNPGGAPSYDPGTGTIIGGSTSAAPLPNQCGNSYSVTVLLAHDWRFYTIAFSEFQQANRPNRAPNPDLPEVGNVAGTGLLTSKLRVLILRLPREAITELWIDDLAFYRKKG